LEHENEKILIDTGIGYSKDPVVFMGEYLPVPRKTYGNSGQRKY
jgi:hypothetical protein